MRRLCSELRDASAQLANQMRRTPTAQIHGEARKRLRSLLGESFA
jgi:hypothetical protein